MALTQNGSVDRSKLPMALASRALRLGNSDNITSLQEKAEAVMNDGGGEVAFLLSASGNGKTGTLECRMDCLELFTACGDALDLYATLKRNGASADAPAVTTSYADFSCLGRY